MHMLLKPLLLITSWNIIVIFTVWFSLWACPTQPKFYLKNLEFNILILKLWGLVQNQMCMGVGWTKRAHPTSMNLDYLSDDQVHEDVHYLQW